MTPRNLLITILLFSLVVVGLGSATLSMASQYGTTYDDSWSATYNKINNITTDMNTAETQLQASGASPVGFLEYISTGAWQSLKLIANSGSLVKVMAEDTGNRYNIPPLYINVLLAIVSVTIIFGIISAVFRRTT